MKYNQKGCAIIMRRRSHDIGSESEFKEHH